MDKLMRKIEELAYRVESFGDLGAERELDELRKELRQRQSNDRNQVEKILRVA